MHLPAIKPSDDDIHRHLFEAILGRRLRPGVRLGEEELALHFGVSRTKVRHALARLTQDGVVESRRNHGASVADPSRARAREVVELRLMVEPPLVAALAVAETRARLAPLRRHLAKEDAARLRGDEAALVQLTGEFHLALAELHGSGLLQRIMRETEALFGLCILRYGRADAAACPGGEHRAILDAIEACEPARAAKLMRHHLGHVAAGMDLTEPPDRPVPLGEVLGPTANGRRRRTMP